MAYITKFNGTTDATIQLGKDGSPTSIEGYYLGAKDTVSDYGPGKLHIFKTQEGTIGVWGKTRMNSLLSDNLRGQMCLLTFTGMLAPTKKGRRPSYNYNLQHDPENTIDVSTVDLNVKEVESDNVDEASYDDDITEAAPPAPVAPKVAARIPNADSQARVQALLNKGRTARTSA